MNNNMSISNISKIESKENENTYFIKNKKIKYLSNQINIKKN